MKKKRKGNRPAPSAPGPAASIDYPALLKAIEQTHHTTQRQAVQAVNLGLTLRNWMMGYYIVEYEQRGSDRAKYGERLLDQLAGDLRRSLGKGFGKRYLELFRQFYLRYPIAKTVFSQLGITLSLPVSVTRSVLEWQDDEYFHRLFTELSWGHLIELMRIDDLLKRSFYEAEILKNRWSLREFRRQKDSLLYERLRLSRDKKAVLAIAKEGEIITQPREMIRDPYVFEFLGLKREASYVESKVESALLDHLQDFLMELGKGFTFVARQQRVTIDNDHYYIDLLLYHRKLKCLVAIDLKTGPFQHEYAGSMNFYLNYLKAEEMEEGENPPIGIILCTDKKQPHVEYALGGLSNKVFVSSYLLHLPREEELIAVVQRTRRALEE